ncbi:MAG: hypothetical protein K8F52_14425 [Candidatus Scalindua rubra]|uniref:Uncharacterized protein n=1 Tax=Candidatus Scalindua brodae TaxID=237368 RepID=A0A0B0ES52_9BACT|nr:MAG: hypothetical protein SCABRO_00261 [Candidatus Scalindua brodae]MBZ0109845.1 hypothetical protein [Candidatus Scalindua rubra]TWU33078.1 hypothetical protein S225a_15280 [Candidatus Brocadiaceae bacterium S225]
MKQQLREKVFSSLNMSNEKALDEMAYLISCNKLAEFTSEIEFYGSKYHTTFERFDKDIQSKKGSFGLENDWLAWRFSVEGEKYWQNIVGEITRDTSHN